MLTKQQKRRLAGRVGEFFGSQVVLRVHYFHGRCPSFTIISQFIDAHGELPRGWNWVDIVKVCMTSELGIVML